MLNSSVQTASSVASTHGRYSGLHPAITAFTVIIQSGAVLATILFLRKDIARVVPAFLRGLFNAELRAHPDFRFGWAVLLGSIPIVIVALIFKDDIETTLRSLWFVAGALIVWSGVMATGWMCGFGLSIGSIYSLPCLQGRSKRARAPGCELSAPRTGSPAHPRRPAAAAARRHW